MPHGDDDILVGNFTLVVDFKASVRVLVEKDGDETMKACGVEGGQVPCMGVGVDCSLT